MVSSQVGVYFYFFKFSHIRYVCGVLNLIKLLMGNTSRKNKKETTTTTSGNNMFVCVCMCVLKSAQVTQHMLSTQKTYTMPLVNKLEKKLLGSNLECDLRHACL